MRHNKVRKLLLSTTLMATLLLSCQDTIDQSPVKIETMASILTDLHIAEYYSQGLGEDIPKFKRNTDSLAHYYQSILAHHSLTLAEFDTAMNWLMHHPEIMDSVYLRINTNIEELRKTYKTQRSNSDVLPEDQIRPQVDSFKVQPINQDTTRKEPNQHAQEP